MHEKNLKENHTCMKFEVSSKKIAWIQNNWDVPAPRTLKNK